MSATANGSLQVYMLNVGQADTTLIVSPGGMVMVIDARHPSKIMKLLDGLGNADKTVEHLIITHPHEDHFSGGNSLARNRTILEATVAPFWHEFGMGPSTYRQLMGRLLDQNTNVTFLSGYSRWYPDGPMTADPQGGDPIVDLDAPFLELLGPTNGLIGQLERDNVFNANHLSIMTRIAWRNFRMLITGDAQMENWAAFDSEGLLGDSCQVLRTAHHGSPNGTQFERIMHLKPSLAVVSSDPGGGHHLPDLGSTAIFIKHDSKADKMAVITRDTGSIHLEVDSAGNRTLTSFGETASQEIDLGAGVQLDGATNPTRWIDLLNQRVAEL